jgi:hypothetical protein
MDRRLAQDLDRWLTTPPDEPPPSCEQCAEWLVEGTDADTGKPFHYCPNCDEVDAFWGADETPDYPMYEG